MYQTYRLATTTLVFVVFFLLQAVAGAQNLLVNGDFSLGNTGFKSDYVFTSDTQPEGTYCVDTDPHNCHPGVASYPDHTSGNGRMLSANGSVSPGQVVWQQTVTVAPQTPYTFSGWAASCGDVNGFDPSPTQLRFFINGVHVGQDFAVASQNGQWLPFVISWNSEGNTSATIAIVDVNVDAFGNDFSLDDLGMDATTVNAATVRFGAIGTEAAPVHVAVEDVNGDGRPDLLLHFNTQDTHIQCGETSASLTAQTSDGQAIQGSDSIQTVGCK